MVSEGRMLVGIAWVFAQEPPPIVNGESTEDYPEVVLLYAETSQGAGLCSGSLIAPEWVMTAAHCVTGVQRLTAYVGTDSGDGLEQEARAEDWFAHPRYTGSGGYDIALIHLRDTFADVPLMAVVDQPFARDDVGEDFRLVGWGTTGDDDNSRTYRKRTVVVPLYDYDDSIVMTYDSGRQGGNACHGDSGGPLLRPFEDGTYAVVGVMDYVSPGCEGGALGAARVDYYLDWIHDYTDTSTVEELASEGFAATHPATPDPSADVVLEEDPARPKSVEEDYASSCSTGGRSAPRPLVLLAALLAVAGLRRSVRG